MGARAGLDPLGRRTAWQFILDLPRPLMWMTGNIGIHHLHHLCSRIPFYRLPEVLKDHPELKSIGRITLWQSLKCVRLTLWDEKRKQLVPFA